MIFKIITGLLIVLIGCSDKQQTSISGLRIDNGVNRGVGYTDSLGTPYNLRYIPITITNESIIPIHLQIAFSNEYNYPTAYGGQKFNVFPFPKEMSPDEVTYDSISYELGDNELHDFLDSGFDTPYILNKTIKPSEKFVVAIGTLYPRPPKVCGVLPNKLFVQSDKGVFPKCDWLMKKDLSTNSPLALGLKLDFCGGDSKGSCTIIPCGQISYPER